MVPRTNVYTYVYNIRSIAIIVSLPDLWMQVGLTYPLATVLEKLPAIGEHVYNNNNNNNNNHGNTGRGFVLDRQSHI